MKIARRRFIGDLASSLALASLFCIGIASPALAQQGNSTVRVMTRNMDAGTDLNYLTAATSGSGFVAGLFETIAEVDASNIPARAARLAAEIAAAKPDLVALQEVTLWDISDNGGVFHLPNHRVYDQLALLQAALTAAGQDYRVVAVQTLTDIPVSLPDVLTARFTDHNAILVRRDVPPGLLDVTSTETHLFEHYLPFTLPDGTSVPVLQGWMAADVRIRGARFKVVNTHLLSPIPGPHFADTVGVQALQAIELVQGLTATSLPIILAGDFNSDAEAANFGPDQTPSAGFIAGSGYTDAWHLLHPTDTGFTWPLFLEDQASPIVFPLAVPVERIDLVFARGATVLSVEQTGVSGGVFASDHAGVVADFALDNHRPDVPVGRK